jgi:hypothetical protein
MQLNEKKQERLIGPSFIETMVKDNLHIDINRIEVSDWYGSCQYSAAEDTHRLLNEVGPNKMGVEYRYFNTKPTKALLADWKDELVRAEDTELLKDDKYLKSSLSEIAKWGANQAWDLWSVAFWLADFQSKNTLVYGDSRIEGLETVQCGIACWFLVERCRVDRDSLDNMST